MRTILISILLLCIGCTKPGSVFIPPSSGELYVDYYKGTKSHAGVFGEGPDSNLWGQYDFMYYNFRYQNAFLRRTGPPALLFPWGDTFNEVTEFVPVNGFIMQTGFYTNGSDGYYHPSQYNNDMSKHFSIIQELSAFITTPEGVYDITDNFSIGEPYALEFVPKYIYTIQFEGYIINAENPSIKIHYIHITTWYPPQNTTDIYFSGLQTQRSIRQSEVWWDEYNGWGNYLSQPGVNDYSLDTGSYWRVTVPSGLSAGLVNSF